MTAKEHYQQLIQDIRWFFFELLILCYVEDPATGLSFHFPAGLSWALYAEVQYGPFYVINNIII